MLGVVLRFLSGRSLSRKGRDKYRSQYIEANQLSGHVTDNSLETKHSNGRTKHFVEHNFQSLRFL